eukprot:scaffold172822_cov60-Attheya_sp.AAC.3
MQQENLLQDIKKDLEEIKAQLLTINRSLEEKNQERKRDKENKVSSAEQRFIDAQKEEYSVTRDHRQARRIAREWSKKRTLETNEKKRKAILDSIDNYGVSFGSYNIDRLRNSGEGFDSTSEDESRDGRHSTKKKKEVPLFYGGDAEAMIRTVREFDEVTDDLEFTEAHEKFTNFRKRLRDVARDDWDTAKVGQDMTIAGFKATMYAWKLMILPEDICEAQKNYIETVKKPYTMTVRDFVKRLRQMAFYLPEFPRPMAATALSETDLKNIIFHGMPTAWQENFVHANMRISSITLAQMTDYLASEQVIADTRRYKNPRGRGSTGRNNHNGRGYNPGRGHGYQGRSYQGRGRSSSNKRS